MDLFNSSPVVNLLPFDGVADYYGRVFNAEESQHYLDWLLADVDWRHDEAVIFGRHITTKRMVAWYGDNGYAYTYSKKTRQSLLWTPDLLKLKERIEAISGDRFNSCLLNLYHDGEEGMAWHSDAEKAMVKDAAIASVSFGADRKFQFRHKASGRIIDVLLENGSLLVMRGTCQTFWLHALPKTKKVFRPRVNLTFRLVEGAGA